MTDTSSIKISILVLFLGILSPGKSALSQEYNKRSDYIYDFESTDAEIVDVILVKSILKLPVSSESFNTAFLEVDIRTTLAGRIVEPKVRVNAKGMTACQYFEFGARGKRYINLSSFVNRGDTLIKLSFDHCRIADKQLKLILYKNTEIEGENLVVLAPHPDDAEIAAYGLYSSNKNVFVATITIGDAGKKMYDELYTNDTVHYLKKAELRLWNSITVPLLAGVDPQNIVNLGYFDASLKQMYSDTSVLAKARYTGVDDININRSQNISSFLDMMPGSSNWQSLVADMKHIIRTKKPSVIVTPYPAIDVHPDHKLTTIALIQALTELRYYDVELWMYTNHFVNDELYPEGKVRSLVSVPPSTSENPIYFNRLVSFPLTDIMQSDKILALEAMNPLRPDTEWHTTRGSRKLYWKTFKENIRNSEQDYYYRRAARSNELFFVVDMKDLLNDSILKILTGDLNF